jgi:hypothetical protein
LTSHLESRLILLLQKHNILMSIKAKVTTQNTINAQVNPDNKIIPKQVSSGGAGAPLTDGDGISDVTYTGTAPKTISVDDSVVRTTGDQTIEGTKTFADTGLNQLNDVTITSASEDDIIKYDGTTSKFVNTAILDGGNF